ncbi:MAG: DUF3459 domain-containing protein [Hymenobacter sp.]|nr:MAG: DUF3459 domain-containing protein [Hymenobacter sp.]
MADAASTPLRQRARRPTPAERQKQKLIAAFQVLYLGSPMFFYGDEAGLWGSNDPDCRKPMLWAERQYTPETHNPDQSLHPADAVAFDPDLFAWYQKFIGLRRRSAALRLGSFTTIATDDARQLYAFRRTLGKEDVLVVLNRGRQPATFTHAVLASRKYQDAFTQAAAPRQLAVPAGGVLVLRAQ